MWLPGRKSEDSEENHLSGPVQNSGQWLYLGAPGLCSLPCPSSPHWVDFSFHLYPIAQVCPFLKQLLISSIGVLRCGEPTVCLVSSFIISGVDFTLCLTERLKHLPWTSSLHSSLFILVIQVSSQTSTHCLLLIIFFASLLLSGPLPVYWLTLILYSWITLLSKMMMCSWSGTRKNKECALQRHGNQVKRDSWAPSFYTCGWPNTLGNSDSSVWSALPSSQKGAQGCTAVQSLQRFWRTDSEKPGEVEEGREATNTLKMERFTILLIFWLWHGKKRRKQSTAWCRWSAAGYYDLPQDSNMLPTLLKAVLPD